MDSYKILVVDDEKPIAELLEYSLKNEGYEVILAHDGAYAVERALNEKPDLILLDLMLPKKSGTEVLKEVREKLDIPIIMLTAKSSEIDKVLGLELGADDYVTKPFSTRELIARVKVNLRRMAKQEEEEKEETKEEEKIKDIPIIMLTAKSSEIDKVLGLELGADDYVTKPFSTRELIARVKVNLRRMAKQEEEEKEETKEEEKIKDIVIYKEAYIIKKNGEDIDLTRREFDLFYYLFTHKGQVMTRENLLQTVWGYDYFGDVRTVDVTIRRLREKIEDDPSKPIYITTRRGVGYFMGEDVDES